MHASKPEPPLALVVPHMQIDSSMPDPTIPLVVPHLLSDKAAKQKEQRKLSKRRERERDSALKYAQVQSRWLPAVSLANAVRRDEESKSAQLYIQRHRELLQLGEEVKTELQLQVQGFDSEEEEIGGTPAAGFFSSRRHEDAALMLSFAASSGETTNTTRLAGGQLGERPLVAADLLPDDGGAGRKIWTLEGGCGGEGGGGGSDGEDGEGEGSEVGGGGEGSGERHGGDGGDGGDDVPLGDPSTSLVPATEREGIPLPPQDEPLSTDLSTDAYFAVQSPRLGFGNPLVTDASHHQRHCASSSSTSGTRKRGQEVLMPLDQLPSTRTKTLIT